MSEKIKCMLCGSLTHSIQIHLRADHPEVTLDQYIAQFPDEPILSELAKQRLAEQAKAKAAAGSSGSGVITEHHVEGATAKIVPLSGAGGKVAMHEMFGLGAKTKAAMSASGAPIMITKLREPGDKTFLPEADKNFVYDIEVLKNVLLGLELNIPTYLWGHAGVGKSSFYEQVAAHTNRQLMRVQHTVNTEESHIIGQWVAKGGETMFELGPLAIAMRDGMIYMADEYDFALPSVLSVYQPVLEGKSLVIKEADHANRVIKPHPNFRFVATGNTNGSGDETGLYQGTNLQNSANYDRFGIVCKVEYMKPAMETRILMNQADLSKEDAELMVKFGNLIREAYDGSKISATISPRALINASIIGTARGDLKTGIRLAFANKLSRVDSEMSDGLAQRIFG